MALTNRSRAESGLAALLDRAEILESIDRVGRSLLLGGARPMSARAGTGLLRQGDNTDVIFYVVSGLVGIEMYSQAPDAALVDLVWEGGFFGTPARQSAGVLPFGATALEECELLKIDGERIARVVERCGHCARAALRIYENILMRSIRLHRLRMGGVDARLQSFQELFEPVHHRLTKAQTASLIDVSTASLYRALSGRRLPI